MWVATEVQGKGRKVWLQLIAFQHVLAIWQWQSWQASCSPCLTGKGKEMEGLNQLCDLLLPENVELSGTFCFTQIFRAVVNYPHTLQMQTYLELMLFMLCLA